MVLFYIFVVGLRSMILIIQSEASKMISCSKEKFPPENGEGIRLSGAVNSSCGVPAMFSCQLLQGLASWVQERLLSAIRVDSVD